MELSGFLKARGADLAELVGGVAAEVGLGTGDHLYAVGSLVEGLGNSKSDVDLILVTPRDPGGSAPRGDVAVVVGRCLVDVRILPSSELDALVARFEDWCSRPWNVTHALKFALEERTLLHRLLHGRLLHCDEASPSLRLPALRDLARLKLHVARQMARTIQVDLIGYREHRDFRTLAFASQELLGHAVDALAAGHLLTNPTAKWRTRMLSALPEDWERRIWTRPSGLTAVERVWRLHRAPEEPNERDVLAHALRISAFARSVFAWSEGLLVHGSADGPCESAWPPPEGSALPWLDFDVDFLFDSDRAYVARLNEFGDPVELSRDELRLALLFDGETTTRAAERAVLGANVCGQAASLVAKLAGAGLVVQ